MAAMVERAMASKPTKSTTMVLKDVVRMASKPRKSMMRIAAVVMGSKPKESATTVRPATMDMEDVGMGSKPKECMTTTAIMDPTSPTSTVMVVVMEVIPRAVHSELNIKIVT